LNVVHTGHASQLWQAYDDANQRVVGVKTLLAETRTDREQLGFLRREYLVGKKIDHPSIIKMYAFAWDDRGQPYLAMEWFASWNMKRWLLQGGEEFTRLIPQIIDQAGEALSYFNKMGWVHRDVKPDNFLVSESGEVKLIDFALAQPIRHGLAKFFAFRSRVIQGTKSYMSPEQIRGDVLDERADVYSFACTVHELVSGKPLFTGSSVNELLSKHLKSPPSSLEALRPSVTKEFAQLVRRSLSKKPKDRPKTVGEFLREFRAIRVFRATQTLNS
jgi:serine/threonine protein kinase